MKNFILCTIICFLLAITGATKQSCAQKNPSFLTGSIRNYSSQSLYVYQCYGDTLLLADSMVTDKNGEFTFSTDNKQFHPVGLYKVNLSRNQWFYVLYDNKPIKIKTVFLPDMFNNWASDSLEVVKSEENKMFYEFQKTQKHITVANYIMKEMMRLYPLQDPFHKQIENEYFSRYQAMDIFVRATLAVSPSIAPYATKIIHAYYQPLNPDWKQPDNWRDSIIAAHYFDYFNPADSFYLNTNILPEKIDNYFILFSFLMRVNRETSSDYEKHIIKAADEFLSHTVDTSKLGVSTTVHEFCLEYILKKLDKEKMYDALFSVYDKWVYPVGYSNYSTGGYPVGFLSNGVYQAKAGNCEQTNPALNKWREKVSMLRNIQTGSIAPDFEIEKGKLTLSSLQSDYTLLLFWATWCPHCTQEVPEIKNVVDKFSPQLITVAISLDTDNEQWQKFITENNLLPFLNYSELKGWQSEVVKKYNVYATPTMFLLDKDKKIITKPENAEQLINTLMTNSK